MLRVRIFGLREREFFMEILLVQIHFIIVMMRWTGFAPWEFEFPFPDSFTSSFLFRVEKRVGASTVARRRVQIFGLRVGDFRVRVFEGSDCRVEGC